MKKIVVVLVVMMMFSCIVCSAENTGEYSLSDDEREVICRFVLAIGEESPFVVKIALCNVVLNRLRSSAFPNDIVSIVYAPNEFPEIQNGNMETAFSEKSITSARKALSCAEGGLDVSGGALKFAAGDASRLDELEEITLLIGSYAFGI